jgi:carbamoyltransferase
MITCGLKLTHDGAVALFDEDRLAFCVEAEKLNNNLRFSPLADLQVITDALAMFGYAPDDVGRWVVDGWDGRHFGVADVITDGISRSIRIAPYREEGRHSDVLGIRTAGVLPLAGKDREFTSYVHAAGHILSAYATSEAALRGEDSFVLVWDGGLFPMMYYVDAAGRIESGGELFPLIGHAYATAAHHFGPYRRRADAATIDDLSVAGKLMAYIALGEQRDHLVRLMTLLFDRHFDGQGSEARAYRAAIGGFGSSYEPSMDSLHAFFRALRDGIDGGSGGSPDLFREEDVLTSFHVFLETLLVERIKARVLAWKGAGPWNLCLVGGCALNIKWNSAIRRCGLFSSVWVPPFPNDSGSAIGAASALLFTEGLRAVRWHVHSGPMAEPLTEVPDGWSGRPMSPESLGRLLAESGEPVVLVDGRAELGPRALGGRSIIASAVRADMKDLLNKMKKREDYRPVAPVCLAEHAREIFDPGTPDPYMLYEHVVRDTWRDRIPAVLHLDGTARLQTVTAGQNPVLTRILTEYYRATGIPVLCNTSANYNGRGFFPGVRSALEWGEAALAWSNDVLYERRKPE